MADSAVISKELREYLASFKIEETLTSLVNRLARAMPPDPFSFMSGILSEMSSASANITGLRAYEVLLESFPSLQVEVLCDFKGQVFPGPAFTFSLDDEDEHYNRDREERAEGKGMRQAATLIAGSIRERLQGVSVTDQRKADSTIVAGCESAETKAPLGTNTVAAVSFAVALAGAFFASKPLYRHIASVIIGEDLQRFKPVRLLVNFLHTGKRFNTKNKFRKFSLYETTPGRFPPEQSFDNFKKIYSSFRQLLASGKGGEAALKQHADGAFIAPYDSIGECCKMMDEAVTHAGFSPGEDYSVFILCGAEDFFLPDAGKYEMEGFKQPLDVNQLGDFYVKLLNDRRSIGVLEDPLAPTDAAGWTAVSAKLAQAHPNSRLSGNRLLSNRIEAHKALFDPEEGQSPQFRPHLVSIKTKGTVSEALEFQKVLMKAGVQDGLVLREALYESSDASLVDLAFGLQAEFLEVGPPLKWSRLAKYNRWVAIAREILPSEAD